MPRKYSFLFIPAVPHTLTQTGCKVLLVSALALVVLTGCDKAPAKAVAVPEVTVVQPVQRDVPVYLDLVGQAQGKQDVEIRARVEGYLESVNYTEGSYVTKGTLLYQIDPKPLQADLANIQAKLTKTTNDVTRLRPLAAKQAVSQQELDNAVSARDAAQASFDLAKLNLGYTTITSPIDGVVGITQVKAGNLVGRGESTLLTTVSQVDPIVFRVGISEGEYLKLAQREPRPTAEREIELLLANGSIYPQKGAFSAVDRAIDANTGTLAVEFSFANPDRLLRPGQYGRVHITSDKIPSALLVPQRAVNEIQGTFQVAVVDGDNKVELRAVKTGPRVGNLWVIAEGLQPGEQVVAEGLQRVRNGMVVSPQAATLESLSSSPAKP